MLLRVELRRKLDGKYHAFLADENHHLSNKAKLCFVFRELESLNYAYGLHLAASEQRISAKGLSVSYCG